MDPLRRLRKGVTFGPLDAAIRTSRRAAGPRSIEALRGTLLRTARLAWPLRRRVATHMRLAGVYRAGLVEAYFERAVDQYVMMAHMLRASTFAASGCGERYVLDDSFGNLERAHAAGRGAILIAPHLCAYPLLGMKVGTRLPCRTYMRRAKDPRKWRLNASALEVGEGHFVYPPADAARTERLKVAVEWIRSGKILYITPDLPRLPGKGSPVPFLGRTAWFRTGAFILALRTRVPVVPALWHLEGGAYRVRIGEPYALSRTLGIQEQAEAGLQAWTADVEAFLRHHPEMWWNWLDRRWSRLLRGQGGVAPRHVAGDGPERSAAARTRSSRGPAE